MKVSNTRAVTGLATASYITRRAGRAFNAVSICGNVAGKVVALCSLLAGKIPAQRELRGIIEGRSVVAAAPWAVFDALQFAVSSANEALDQVAEYGDMIAAALAYRANVIDTLAEHGQSRLQGAALQAFDTRMVELFPAWTMHGVDVVRDGSAGSNGTLVDVERVELDGAVIGHVFLGPNAITGRWNYKAQGNGGILVGWSRDTAGAVRALVAHARKVDLTKVVRPVADVVQVGPKMVVISGEPGKPVDGRGLPVAVDADGQHRNADYNIVQADNASPMRDLWNVIYGKRTASGYAEPGSVVIASNLTRAAAIAFADDIQAKHDAEKAPRGTVAAPGEMIYPATGPSAPAVQQLPADPDGQNDDRAEWANVALEAFAAQTGCDAQDEAIGDLLGNLIHWCDRNGRDFEKELQQGRDYYRQETAPQSCEVCSAQVSELIGAPCGAEVCRACFDNGAA